MTPGTSPDPRSKRKAEHLEQTKSAEAPRIPVNKDENDFMNRMNNVKDERKKRNVTFHGIPEVQEEQTPRAGVYD